MKTKQGKFPQKIRLYNAKLLSLPEAEIQSQEVWIEGNRIAYVGDACAGTEFDQEIDLQGNLILPGFKNAHTHSAMTFLRSYADDLPLLEWLQHQVIPMEQKLTEQAAYVFTQLAILEYLSSGVTTVFDMYFFEEQVLQAAMDMNFRAVMCGAFSDHYNDLNRLETLYQKYRQKELVDFRLGYHAEYSSGKQTLLKIKALSDKYQAPLYTHICESLAETEDCIARTGMTPPQYLDSLGMFDHGGAVFHGVHLTDQDIELLKRRNIAIVTNPGSNSKLASGIAPLTKFMEAGIKLAIGTDGAASNNALDMFREMYLATVLQKLKNQDAAAMPPIELLKMAISGGADVLEMEKADRVAAGYLADLIVIDLQKPNMQPLNNVIKNLVYSGNPTNVKLTMVNGKILYQDGRYPFVDAEAIYAKANQIMEQLKAEVK